MPGGFFFVPRRIRRRGGRDEFDESAACRRWVPRPWPSPSGPIRPAPQANSASSAVRRCGRAPTVPQPLSTIMGTPTYQVDRHNAIPTAAKEPKNKLAARNIRHNPRRRCRRGSTFLGRPAMVLGIGAVPSAPHRGVPRIGVAVNRSWPQEDPADGKAPPPVHSLHRILGGIAETRSHAGGFLRGADAAGRQPPRAFGQVHRGPSLVGKKHVLRSVSQSLPVTPRRRENRRWAGPSGLATLVCPPDRLFSGQMALRAQELMGPRSLWRDGTRGAASDKCSVRGGAWVSSGRARTMSWSWCATSPPRRCRWPPSWCCRPGHRSGLPRLRQRQVDAPFGCGRPVWVDDPSFDIGHQ